mmetsp:Transcript_31666/g.50577  ORF Transcript_31666/g.50577 Transcript_31666/m.50577 type:complete len:109 (+) Transcript_31666:1730-2056(+)
MDDCASEGTPFGVGNPPMDMDNQLEVFLADDDLVDGIAHRVGVENVKEYDDETVERMADTAGRVVLQRFAKKNNVACNAVKLVAAVGSQQLAKKVIGFVLTEEEQPFS